MSTLTATFAGRPAADRALGALMDAGVSPEHISVLFNSPAARSRYFPEAEEISPNLIRGVFAGSIAGLVLGAVLGSQFLGITFFAGGALPQIGLSPLAGAQCGGIVGFAMGGFLGGLAGAGLTRPVVQPNQLDVSEDAVLIAVQVPADEVPAVEGVLRSVTQRTD